MDIKRNLLVVLTIMFCVISIVVSILIYSIEDKEYNEANLDEDLASIDYYEDITGEVSLSNIIENEVSIPELEKESEFENIILPEIDLSKEESLAKLWFDIRTENSEEKLVELIQELEEYFKQGRVPQIVSKFPLTLIDDTDFGFIESNLRTSSKVIKVITMVVPKFLDNSDRVTTFIYEENKLHGDVLVVSDPIVPNTYGAVNNDKDYTFFVAGEVLDEHLFTDQGSIGLLSIKVNSDWYLGDIYLENLKGAVVNRLDHSVIIKSEEYNFPAFFYNEVENEGQTTDELFIITPVGMYKFITMGETATVELIETLEEENR